MTANVYQQQFYKQKENFNPKLQMTDFIHYVQQLYLGSFQTYPAQFHNTN